MSATRHHVVQEIVTTGLATTNASAWLDSQAQPVNMILTNALHNHARPWGSRAYAQITSTCTLVPALKDGLVTIVPTILMNVYPIHAPTGLSATMVMRRILVAV